MAVGGGGPGVVGVEAFVVCGVRSEGGEDDDDVGEGEVQVEEEEKERKRDETKRGADDLMIFWAQQRLIDDFSMRETKNSAVRFCF